jgi:hypothetical protein
MLSGQRLSSDRCHLRRHGRSGECQAASGTSVCQIGTENNNAVVISMIQFKREGVNFLVTAG